MFLKLKVHPGSKQSLILKKAPDAYEAWVRSKAERGLANQEALSLLSKELGIEGKKLRIVKGALTPNKIIQYPQDAARKSAG